MNVVSSPAYYGAMKLLWLLLLALVALHAFRSERAGTFLLFGCAFICGCLMILVSLHHSWTFDYQAQGRYLFPILPMLAFASAPLDSLQRSFLFKLLVIVFLAFATSSFAFSALPALHR